MVAGFIKYLWRKEGGDTFFSKEFNFKKIKQNCKRFVNYQSDNDPWVPIEHGISVSKILNARLEIVSGAGHFNTEAGYTKFQILLNDILSNV